MMYVSEVRSKYPLRTSLRASLRCDTVVPRVEMGPYVRRERMLRGSDVATFTKRPVRRLVGS
jgi:hypothetical protein